MHCCIYLIFASPFEWPTAEAASFHSPALLLFSAECQQENNRAHFKFWANKCSHPLYPYKDFFLDKRLPFNLFMKARTSPNSAMCYANPSPQIFPSAFAFTFVTENCSETRWLISRTTTTSWEKVLNGNSYDRTLFYGGYDRSTVIQFKRRRTTASSLSLVTSTNHGNKEFCCFLLRRLLALLR